MIKLGVGVVKELEQAAIERLALLWLLQPACQAIFGQHAEHTVGPNVLITVWMVNRKHLDIEKCACTDVYV